MDDQPLCDAEASPAGESVLEDSTESNEIELGSENMVMLSAKMQTNRHVLVNNG